MRKLNPVTHRIKHIFQAVLWALLLVQPATSVWAQDDDQDDRRVRRLGDTVAEQQEFSLEFPTDLTANQPAVDIPEVTLPNAGQDAQLQDLLAQLAYNPGDAQLTAQLDTLLSDVEGQADTALNDGNLVLATQLMQAVNTVSPNRPAYARITQDIQRRRNVNELLTAGQTALQEGRLIAPQDDNAAAYFNQVLGLEADNPAAQSGLQQIHQTLVDTAMGAARDLDFETASARLDEAEQLGVDADSVDTARAQVTEIGVQRAEQLTVSVGQAIDDGRFDEAESQLNELIALGGNVNNVQRLRRSLADARVYGGFKPGQTFSDNFTSANGQGPLMVVMPAGSFTMGSPDSEAARVTNEGPTHLVTFERGFGLSQTEITVAQFRRFVDLTGYRTDAERESDSTVYDEESGRLIKDSASWQEDYAGGRAEPEYPVIHISWNDATRYVEWLSEMTGRRYRLPSEAEFEYAVRGGNQGLYWWGDDHPGVAVENLTGDGDVSRSRRRWNDAFNNYEDGYWGPAPVASFQPNPFGLYDINGNVKEWLVDCWHDTYVRAPQDGSAWVNQGCHSRIIRGGDWTSTPTMSRSAFRVTAAPETRGARVGFRVARDL